MSTNPRHLQARELLPDQSTSLQQAPHSRLSPAAGKTTVVKSNSFDAIRFSLNSNFGSSVRPAFPSVTDRSGSGIPTPPYSETTSSASGSVGRARKDPSDASSSHSHISAQRSLRPPVTDHTTLTSSRSPSAASSSNTGSDTVGATSPRQPEEARFHSSRSTALPEGVMAADAEAALPPNGRMSLSQRDAGAGDSSDSPSALRPSSSMSSHTSSPGERRKRRSEMHERDVTQIRSESRLGLGNADDDDELHDSYEREQHAFPRTAQHKYSPRKSTTLSIASHRYDENDATDSNEPSLHQRASVRGVGTSSPPTPTSTRSPRYTGGDEMPSGSMRRLSRTVGQASSRAALDARPASSAGRSPMPSEFRLPGKEIRRAYRAAHQRTASDSDGSDAEKPVTSKTATPVLGDKAELRSPPSTRRESLDEIQEEGALDKPTGARSPKHRRAFNASESAASATTTEGNPARMDYEGRLGTQGSRISVDSSSVQKYLARGSQHSTPSSSARRSTLQSSDVGSPSEDARARKISTTSSNRSQKSSSSASELHRAASRVSMRNKHGSDLFSTDTAPSSSASAAPYSPSVRTETSYSSNNSSERSRAYLDQPRRVDDVGLDSLRSQIQDLRVGRAESEADRRRATPMSLRTQAYLASKRSSLDLNSPHLGSVRAQSVIGLQRTTNDPFRALQMPQYPSTDPQRSRFDRSLPVVDPDNSSDAVRRIQDLVRLRGGANAQPVASARSATSLGMATDSFAASATPAQHGWATVNTEEPAPIRNLAVRLAQYEALYSKAPSADASPAGSTAGSTGPHTARTVELLSAIVRGTSTMWAELASMHPIATEGHLMGRPGDAFTEAFGQLDEGFAFVNKLVLEQARAMQDLMFLLDRTEKERQAQFNQALVDMGRSPRPFSRIGTPTAAAQSTNGIEAGTSAERNAHALRRATSTVRSGSSLAKDSPSPFTRTARGAGSSAERSGTLTASQLRSMTSLGYTNNHARSASEFSPSSAAAQRRLDRASVSSPREASTDSPLSSRRRVFPTTETVGGDSGVSSGADVEVIRPPTGLTPRRPRLSNPSVSNATASLGPFTASAAPSVFASSPEGSLHNGTGGEQMDSEGSTVGEHGRFIGEVDEFGRVAAPAEMTRGSSRSQRTVRGPRVIDTLASQLDTLRGDEVPVDSADRASRRHTMGFHGEPTDLLRSPPKPAKATPPPRPPRHIQRPSEEYISSPERRHSRREQSTPTTPQTGDVVTPRQPSRASTSIEEEAGGASAMVRSLGRTAARRVSRVLGSGQ
ncbi:hypothetical protein PSEUBRA_004117 [Kalmanozyma brasiliensis GHG001]|uniref:uncharacterized protein n=1 Tax=Kalmanozyma brasiliensis (strain GHG001) TaxID=1365824 RepID=UPI002867BE86|nr:uncharacterized protein PSEUBRA_004117 [Kalmanozyma brasiliensis GHG001]KAF6767341.1 hypothetical protein PSEUBRA_004117 [Kalmanozyma brasiliensis GHG001]